jgi:hypothetical protein
MTNVLVYRDTFSHDIQRYVSNDQAYENPSGRKIDTKCKHLTNSSTVTLQALCYVRKRVSRINVCPA